MRKKNTKKQFPNMPEAGSPTSIIHESLPAAKKAAVEEAERANVMPTAIMHSTKEGYVTGDGMEHTTTGVDANRQQQAPNGEKIADKSVKPQTKKEDVVAAESKADSDD